MSRDQQARSIGRLCLIALMLGALVGCAGPDTKAASEESTGPSQSASAAAADEGGCNARVRYQGKIYRAVATHGKPLRQGESLGTAPFADCAGAPAPELGTARLSSAGSMDPKNVVFVEFPGADADEPPYVYVEADLRPGQWPTELKQIAN
jgi:hypothetical protein